MSRSVCLNDAGESTASINTRMADVAWPMVEQQLRDGAVLQKLTGLRDYYTQGQGMGFYSRMLPASRVKKLAADGVLVRIGVDMYGLAGATR